MPRPQRIEFKDAWYHVINRSDSDVFTKPSLYKLFLQVLQETAQTYGIGIHCYCLQKQSYDLLVSTPNANLSTAMRHINSVFTQDYNRLMGNEGGVFNGRFKSVLVDPQNHGLQVSRYIHCLPERMKPARQAARYQWSSLQQYLSANSAQELKVEIQPLLELIKAKNKKAFYRNFIEQGVDEFTQQFYHRKNLRSIIGTPGFVKQAMRKRGANHKLKKRDMKFIASATAKHFRVDVRSLFHSLRGPQGGNIPRAVTMLMGRQVGQHTLKEIADYFDIDDVSTVSITIKRLKNKLDDQPKLNKAISTLKVKLDEKTVK